MRSTTIGFVFGAAILAAACVRSEDASASTASQDIAQFVGTSTANGSSATDAQPGARPLTGSDADPCTFFSKAEIEAAFGLPYGPPKKSSTITGQSCMFYNPNTGTVSVRVGEVVTRAQFDSLRTALGENAEPVSGVGQTAFFWVGRLYVLNNGRQLVVSMSGEMTPQFRAALIKLGRLGAPRLRG